MWCFGGRLDVLDRGVAQRFEQVDVLAESERVVAPLAVGAGESVDVERDLDLSAVDVAVMVPSMVIVISSWLVADTRTRAGGLVLELVGDVGDRRGDAGEQGMLRLFWWGLAPLAIACIRQNRRSGSGHAAAGLVDENIFSEADHLLDDLVWGVVGAGESAQRGVVLLEEFRRGVGGCGGCRRGLSASRRRR